MVRTVRRLESLRYSRQECLRYAAGRRNGRCRRVDRISGCVRTARTARRLESLRYSRQECLRYAAAGWKGEGGMSGGSSVISPRNRPLNWTALFHQGRVFVLGLAVFVLMSGLAPNEFPTAENLGNILRAASTDALAAAGFTLVMLCGQLDLSVGMIMTTGGVVAMFLQPVLGWVGAVAAAALAGMSIGLVNGLLVARARINSFIVTLGTLTILQGLNRALLQGGSKSLDDVAAGMSAVEWLQPILPWS
ncbi:MAG: ABC transporter permease, partial [Verrucomicrobia bacterium]|nr:ABC transporter permease [Verrucomicrobiota bacterium]